MLVKEDVTTDFVAFLGILLEELVLRQAAVS
jgi:hypothetical protein